MKNKILIVGGEPNSINTEILFKCWKKLSPNLKSTIKINLQKNGFSDYTF